MRHGENYVSYWDVSAVHTHYVGARGNAELERSLKLACRRGKGLGTRFAVHNSFNQFFGMCILFQVLFWGALMKKEEVLH
jgi:hypothetical protein